MKSERAVRLALSRWEKQARKERAGQHHNLNVGVAACETWLQVLGWVLDFDKDPTTEYYHSAKAIHEK